MELIDLIKYSRILEGELYNLTKEEFEVLKSLISSRSAELRYFQRVYSKLTGKELEV